MRIRAFIACALFALLAFIAGASACRTGVTPCTPDEHGLEDTPRLAFRELPGRGKTEGACLAPRLQVLGSEAELRAFYDQLAVAAADGGAPGDAGYQTVDFSKETVIIREGSDGERIQWTTVRGDTGFVGLLSCATNLLNIPQTCRIDVVAVPATLSRVESRTCEPVGCGRGGIDRY